ncbi:MAG: SRPBCC domain-containing protein [Bacteroidia bacterium]|nr:SRPBCC domain-containing protein [Bacteroidia bacterium]
MESTASASYKTTILVDQSPEEVFKAINNVRGWWSENIMGATEKINDEFFYNYKDVHVCKMRITEFVQDKKVVWLVLENQFNFTKDKSEWKGNSIVFEISRSGDKTRMDFRQIGLVPEYECYSVCQDAWTSYIQGSLKSLITTGKGKPNTKENDLNKELVEKWGLPNK